jgi:uncharacterized protein (DUF362 family)
MNVQQRNYMDKKPKEFSESVRSRIVSLTKVNKDLYAALTKAIYDLGQPVITPGDSVLIKPNLVNPNPPDSGQITSPRLIEVVARYCLDRGAARVIIGEGPGYYNRKADLRDCFTTTGVSELADRLGIEWVLFDEHRYRTFKKVSDCTPDTFRVTEFAFNCDKLINLPVLKTHYLTKVTLAMKNLKGCLKWEDKPLFHQPDLSRAVVELNKIVRPTINVIDAINWQAGGGLLITGSDIVAVDAVGTALMGIDPMQVRMIALGAAAGLGEADITRIEIRGEELKQMKFKVKLPQEQLQQSFPSLEIVGIERACSGCMIPLISVLMQLREQGAKMKRPLTICLGKNPQVPENKPYLLIGDCAEVREAERGSKITGCAPDRKLIYDKLAQSMTEKAC